MLESPLTVSEPARLAELEREDWAAAVGRRASWAKQPPSSRKTVGERAVFVHRCGEGVLGVPGQLGGCMLLLPRIDERLLRLACAAAVGHGGPACRDRWAGRDRSRGLGRNEWVPACPPRPARRRNRLPPWQLVRRVMREEDCAGAQPAAYRVHQHARTPTPRPPRT